MLRWTGRQGIPNRRQYPSEITPPKQISPTACHGQAVADHSQHGPCTLSTNSLGAGNTFEGFVQDLGRSLPLARSFGH